MHDTLVSFSGGMQDMSLCRVNTPAVVNAIRQRLLHQILWDKLFCARALADRSFTTDPVPSPFSLPAMVIPVVPELHGQYHQKKFS